MMYMKKISMTPSNRSSMANQPTPAKKKRKKKKKKQGNVQAGRYSSDG